MAQFITTVTHEGALPARHYLSLEVKDLDAQGWANIRDAVEKGATIDMLKLTGTTKLPMPAMVELADLVIRQKLENIDAGHSRFEYIDAPPTREHNPVNKPFRGESPYTGWHEDGVLTTIQEAYHPFDIVARAQVVGAHGVITPGDSEHYAKMRYPMSQEQAAKAVVLSCMIGYTVSLTSRNKQTPRDEIAGVDYMNDKTTYAMLPPIDLVPASGGTKFRLKVDARYSCAELAKRTGLDEAQLLKTGAGNESYILIPEAAIDRALGLPQQQPLQQR